MMRVLGSVLLSASLLVVPAAGGSEAAVEPVHDIEISGTGVGMYPAFSSTVERYGLTTTAGTLGSLTVEASTSDPNGVVLFDGVPTPSGTTTVEDLEVGDEVSVMIKDSAGTAVHALIYLPPQFPAMTANVPATAASSTSDVTLNVSRYALVTPNFEAALDRNGVPRHVRSFPNASQSADLKPGPDGHYLVARSPTPTSGRTGAQIVELDGGFQETGRTFETVGLVDTDQHDAILRPDGSRVLLAYEPNADTGLTDSVIQEVDPQGQVVYTWNSGDHMVPADETVTPDVDDYAHVNSIEFTASGDILASFRNLSTVLKIAWQDHGGGIDRGDILWRLGGRSSDFEFVDDPFGGPCAQHTANELANGNILLFDNGSDDLSGQPSLCLDPEDPDGPRDNRAQTRIAEYAIDQTDGTATLVWDYQVDGRFARFAGSARRLGNGNTLIGWAADTNAVATEVDDDGNVVWELKNEDGYFAYRVAPATVVDVVDPVVTVTSPVNGAAYAYGESVTPEFGCSDRGGSSLHTCSGPAVDTRVAGRHTYQVKGIDGDGNTTTVTRSYTVAPAPFSRPDLLIRAPGKQWIGNNVYFAAGTRLAVQKLRRAGGKAVAAVRVEAQGNRADQVTVRGSSGTPKWGVRYYRGATDVTTLVKAGRLQASMTPGQSFDLRVVTQRLKPAKPGNAFRVAVTATSRLDPRQRDVVAQRVRAIR